MVKHKQVFLNFVFLNTMHLQTTTKNIQKNDIYKIIENGNNPTFRLMQ